MTVTVFTIGHSNHPLDHFLSLLKFHHVTALADVRSIPYSRANPQFNREPFSNELRNAGIEYVFLGKELGARSEDPSCYENGRVQFDRLAQKEPFRQGLGRVRDCLRDHRLALMCAEKEPLNCHRTLLVARHLSASGIDIRHILAGGELENHADLLERLRRELGLPESDLFRSQEDILADAYRIQESRIVRSGSSGPSATTKGFYGNEPQPRQ